MILGNYYLNSSILESLDSVILETVKSKSFTDLSQVMPNILNGSDVKDLLDKTSHGDKVRLLPDD